MQSNILLAGTMKGVDRCIRVRCLRARNRGLIRGLGDPRHRILLLLWPPLLLRQPKSKVEMRGRRTKVQGSRAISARFSMRPLSAVPVQCVARCCVPIQNARQVKLLLLEQQQQQQLLLPPQTGEGDEEQTKTPLRSAFSRTGDNGTAFGTSSKISPRQRTGGDHDATAAVFERLYRSGRPDTDSAISSGDYGTGLRHLELDLALTSTGLSPARRTVYAPSANDNDTTIGNQRQGISHSTHEHAQYRQHHSTGNITAGLTTARSGSAGSSPASAQTSSSRATLLYKLRRIGGTEAASKMVSAHELTYRE